MQRETWVPARAIAIYASRCHRHRSRTRGLYAPQPEQRFLASGFDVAGHRGPIGQQLDIDPAQRSPIVEADRRAERPAGVVREGDECLSLVVLDGELGDRDGAVARAQHRAVHGACCDAPVVVVDRHTVGPLAVLEARDVDVAHFIRAPVAIGDDHAS